LVKMHLFELEMCLFELETRNVPKKKITFSVYFCNGNLLWSNRWLYCCCFYLQIKQSNL